MMTGKKQKDIEEEVSLSPDETKGGGDSDVYRWRDEEIMAGQESEQAAQQSDKSQTSPKTGQTLINNENMPCDMRP